MKTKFLLFNGLFFIASLFAVGCTGGGETKTPDKPVEPDEPDVELTYTLSCDKTQVKLNENVTFTVTSSEGKDVTDDWSICDDTSCRMGRTFGWETAGSYTITAHCTAKPELEAENTLTVKVIGNVYVLSSDKNVIYERESVTFTVTEFIDGVEQTKKPINFQVGIKDGDRFIGMTNTFSKHGVYTVDAYKLDYTTGDIGFRTQNTLEIIVNEIEPSGYEDNFYRRSLFSEGTATWCVNCPDMPKVYDYAADYILRDRMVALAFHDKPGRDECNVEFWQPFYSMLEDYAYYNIPFYVVDWNATYGSQSSVGSVKTAAETLAHSVEASQARYASKLTPGIAVETTLNGRILSIKLKTTPRENANYLLGMVLVEDNLETVQTGGVNGRMVQMHVAQKSITSGTDANRLDALGSLTADTEYTYDYNLTLDDRYVLDNCSVVAYVCKVDSSVKPYGYFCANVVTVKAGKSQPYEYEPIYD